MKNLTVLVLKSEHFCVLPWVHFHAWPNGNVMPCCVADSTKPVSKINKGESIIQMMNSTDYKKMRLDMLEDKPVEACRRCYDLELMGTWTMRQSHNKRRGLEYIDLIKDTTQPDGSLSEFKMKYMDIRFSNMCNMKCRSCGPACSSQWAQEVVDTHGMDHYEKYFHTTKVINTNNEDGSFMSKLKPYLNDVTEVYFAGGEIIITPEHYDCLDTWVENGLTEQVELTYTTNLSVLKYKDREPEEPLGNRLWVQTRPVRNREVSQDGGDVPVCPHEHGAGAHQERGDAESEALHGAPQDTRRAVPDHDQLDGQQDGRMEHAEMHLVQGNQRRQRPGSDAPDRPASVGGRADHAQNRGVPRDHEQVPEMIVVQCSYHRQRRAHQREREHAGGRAGEDRGKTQPDDQRADPREKRGQVHTRKIRDAARGVPGGRQDAGQRRQRGLDLHEGRLTLINQPSVMIIDAGVEEVQAGSSVDFAKYDTRQGDQRRPTELSPNACHSEPAAGAPGLPYGSAVWDQWVKFFVTRDPNGTYLSRTRHREARK